MPELEDQPPDPARTKRRVPNVWISFVGRIIAQIIGAVASVGLGILMLQYYQNRPESAPTIAPPSRPAGQRAIAVLPLDNFSANPDDAYFAAGMTEVLISDLAQLRGWRVTSRTSTAAYRDTTKSVAQIGAELNVGLLVEGSVTKSGDRVRVVIQVIDVPTDEHVFARTYDRAAKDVLVLQSELAKEIAKSLEAAIPVEHEERLVTRAAFDPGVYDLYLRGRQAWNLRTPEGLSSAVKLFEAAVAREPNFALAHVGLADAYVVGATPSAGPLDSRERIAKARASAERAMTIASHMAESQTALGGVFLFGDRDLGAAERAFTRAIELNPNYPLAHQWLAILLAERGRDADARQQAGIAVGLDPMEATTHQTLGLVHYYARRYGDAVASQRQALEIRPQLPFARVTLIKSLMMAGDPAAAVRVCEEAPGGPPANVERLTTCAIAYHRAKDARAAMLRDRLLAAQPRPAAALVQWHAATGDLDRAFAVFDELRARDNVPPSLAFDPLFERLRADARYSPPASAR